VATGGSVDVSQIIGIATTAPDAENPSGKPHVVFMHTLPSGGSEVVYATRTGPSQWTPVSIVQDSPAVTNKNPCDASTATATGQTCNYDYVNHQPIGIAASQSGDVRIFYGVRHYTGTVVAQCYPSQSGLVCNWNSNGTGTQTDTLGVAWVAGGVVSTTDLAATNQPSAATVAIDTTGVMHLALYDALTMANTTTFSTRYLRVGRAGQ
jgi:hypothetical protein